MTRIAGRSSGIAQRPGIHGQHHPVGGHRSAAPCAPPAARAAPAGSSANSRTPARPATAPRAGCRAPACRDGSWPRSDRGCRTGTTVMPVIAAISWASIGRKGWRPCFASPARMPFQEPTCFSQVAPQIQPSRRNSASMPFSLQNASSSVAELPKAMAQPDRALGAAEILQRRELRPLREHHAGIAAAGAAAADIRLDDRHIGRRLPRLDVQRRPQARQARRRRCRHPPTRPLARARSRSRRARSPRAARRSVPRCGWA